MKLSPKPLIALLLISTFALTSCISGKGGKDYSRGQTRGESAVRMGTIVDVNQTKIDGTRTGIGAAAGAVVGAIAGKKDRRDWKGDVGGALAGIIGGVISQGVEQLATQRKGIELIIDLGDNNLTSVVQEDDGTTFKKGDRVRLSLIHI